ncbi:MAG: ABC transporter ATP-binding protein, partial [Clostridia bacterium]
MLQLKRITKVYKTKKGVSQLALDEVELNFGDTGLYFIVGPSGCGKSTLMNIIGGMDSFTSGEFLIDGKSSAAFKPRDFDNYRNKKIGVVFQNFNLLKDLNIKDNIKLSMQLQNKKISDAEIAASIASVGLPGVEKRKPTQLSGGQQQRIAIARALIKNPEIILADEPTGNLDQINSVQIFDLLKQLAKDKLVIVVTHNLQLAKKYADTLIIMQDGKVKKIASRKEQAYAPQTSTNDALTSFGSKKNKGGKDKKAYLSFSKKMSFAFSILRKNWFKTVLLFIMFTFSITMAGIGITAGRYDKVKTTFDTYTGAKITNYYIGDDMRYALNKDGYEENRTEGSTSPFISTFLKKERQDELLSKINNEKLVPMYASDMFCGSSGDIEYFMPINDGIKTKLNYNLLKGALPQNEHEVALSDLAYKRLAFQYNNIDGEPIGLYLEFDGTRLAGICYEKK